MSPVPKLIAFDLDGTLWWPEMYMLSGAPFRQDAKGRVFDRSSERVELMGASEAILHELAYDTKWASTEVAYVSRTEHPKWADACLRLFSVKPAAAPTPGSNGSGGGRAGHGGARTLHELAPYHEIYPGNKTRHFRKILADSGCAAEDILFFDNERWNCTDVSKLGIISIYCPDGMTQEIWLKGLADYAAARQHAAP